MIDNSMNIPEINNNTKSKHPKIKKILYAMAFLVFLLAIILSIPPYYPSKEELKNGAVNAIAVNVQGENFLLPLSTFSTIDTQEVKRCNKIVVMGLPSYCDKQLEEELRKTFDYNIRLVNYNYKPYLDKNDLILASAKEAAIHLERNYGFTDLIPEEKIERGNHICHNPKCVSLLSSLYFLDLSLFLFVLSMLLFLLII